MRQWMQKFIYQTADAGLSLSDSGCRTLSNSQRVLERLSMRQWMQKSFYQRADAGLSLTVSRCSRLSMRQWMQYSLYQDSIYQTADARLYETADAGETLSKERMQDSLYQAADAGLSLTDSGFGRNSSRQQI